MWILADGRCRYSDIRQAARSTFTGGHSINPTFGAFVFGLMIGSPWASTITALALMCISRHFRVLRASSMNCWAYCGASNSGLSCLTLTPPHDLIRTLADLVEPIINRQLDVLANILRVGPGGFDCFLGFSHGDIAGHSEYGKRAHGLSPVRRLPRRLA